MAEYTISQHAKERYAERIMEYNNKVTIVQFINDYGDGKIIEDITNMITYGELIYTGTRTNTPKNNQNANVIVDVYLNGMWIIIVDKAKRNVITLYKIDLGAGDEVDKLFLNNLKQKLYYKKENYNKVLERSSNEIDTFRSEIAENELAINDYKKRIKMMEETNEALKSSIIAKNHDLELAELEVKDVVAKLIGQKVF